MGSVDNSRGARSSVQEATTSFSYSDSFFSSFGSSESSSSRSRGVYSLTESSNRDGSVFCSGSGVLFPHFLGSQENGWYETGYRPFGPQYFSGGSPFQNGNEPFYQGFYSPWHVDNVFGFSGCLFPLSHRPFFQKVPSFRMEQQGFSVPSAPVRSSYSSVGFYQTFSGSSSSSSQPLYSDPFLSGRFSSQGVQPRYPQVSYSNSYSSVPQTRFSDFMEEIRPDTFSGLRLPRGTFQDRSGSNFSPRGKIPVSLSVHSVHSERTVSHCSSVFTAARTSELFSRCGSTGTSSYSSPSVFSVRTLDSSLTGMGGSDSNFIFSSPSSSMVDYQGECHVRTTSSSSSPKSDSLLGCLQPRLGSLSKRSDCLGAVVSSSEERTHQLLGDESCLFGSFSLQGNSVVPVSSSSYRQFDCGGLSRESGRNSQFLPISVSQGSSSLLLATSDSSGCETYPRTSQSVSGLSQSVASSSEHRMGTSSVCVRHNNSSLGQTQYRSFRYQSELQDTNVCISSSRPQGLRSGCYDSSLGGNVRLRIPSIQVSSSCSSEDSRRELQDHSYCSGLAKSSLVSRSAASVLRASTRSSSDSQSSLSVQRQGCSSISRDVSSSRLASVRSNLRQEGFSESAASHISKSVRDSTNCVYDAKWKVFSAWCDGRKINPFQITVQQLADFLVYLFEVKGLVPSTIKGYRSAISRTIALSGGTDFGKNESISLLLRNFSLTRPKQKVLVPQWNLGLVLSYLSSASFEPVDKIDLKLLSYKCCFLLALASGRRRSELHALSVADSCMRFARNRSSVTLLTDPAFLGKNQIPDRGAEPIFIPALPENSDSHSLCPVRILTVYLSRTKSLRSGNNRLFIPIKKGVSDLSVKTISTWICKTISLAYEFSGQSTLDLHTVKAHEVRALSNSWALFNSASLNEVLSAGFWRNENSFISFYLRSMSSAVDDLFSLGPIVSSQRVNFPPVSSVTGDSALC